jgi:hypothetical protein
MSSGLRESVDILDSMLPDGESAGYGTRYDAEILPALRELQAQRRGEFVCARSRMRPDPERPEVEF